MSIIRRIDELGRLCIPKEFRRRAGLLDAGTPVNITISKDGKTIILTSAKKDFFDEK